VANGADSTVANTMPALLIASSLKEMVTSGSAVLAEPATSPEEAGP
jgi:hypothetical protein